MLPDAYPFCDFHKKRRGLPRRLSYVHFRGIVSRLSFVHCPLSLCPLPDCLPVDGVELVIGEDIDGAVTDEFLRRVRGVGIDRRRRGRFVGFIDCLKEDAVCEVAGLYLPTEEGEALDTRRMGYLPMLRFHVMGRMVGIGFEVGHRDELVLKLQVRRYADDVQEVAPDGFRAVEVDIIHGDVEDAGLLVNIIDRALGDGLRSEGEVMDRAQRGTVVESVLVDGRDGRRDEDFFECRTTLEDADRKALFPFRESKRLE